MRLGQTRVADSVGARARESEVVEAIRRKFVRG